MRLFLILFFTCNFLHAENPAETLTHKAWSQIQNLSWPNCQEIWTNGDCNLTQAPQNYIKALQTLPSFPDIQKDWKKLTQNFHWKIQTWEENQGIAYAHMEWNIPNLESFYKDLHNFLKAHSQEIQKKSPANWINFLQIAGNEKYPSSLSFITDLKLIQTNEGWRIDLESGKYLGLGIQTFLKLPNLLN